MNKGKAQDALCCCEYINQDGERSHVLACLCECDALDEVADRCFTCKSMPGALTDRLCNTLQDRTRVPWVAGRGALKVRLDIFLPVVAVPFFIYLGTLHPILTALVVCTCPIFLLCVYRCWSRSANNFRRTKLFFTWAVFSVLFCYLTLMTCLIILRKVYLWELMTLTSLFLLLIYTLVLIKTNSSVVGRVGGGAAVAGMKGGPAMIPMGTRRHRKSRSFSGMEYDGAQGPARPEAELPSIKGFSWCKVCEVEQPPRTAHCPVCNMCVVGRDHHCVWVDECIGAANHRAFFFGLTVYIITGAYGIHLALTSVCTPEMYMNWFLLPNDCRFVYEDPIFSWLFSGAMYTLFSLIMMGCIWCHQCVLISQNITGYELHKAQTRKNSSIFTFCAPNSHFNRGFFHNWSDFLTGRRTRFGLVVNNPSIV